MIEAHGLTKRYGSKTAVDDVTFTVHPGKVTGFLGPNGAGKSTTMRMIVGLDHPTHGTVTVNGRPYAQHRAPARGRRAARREGRPHRSQRVQPPARDGRDARHRQDPGAGGHRDDRARDRRQEAGRRLLARHGPAPGHRVRAARRPAHPDPRRAGERTRPRGSRSGSATWCATSRTRDARSSSPRT